MNQARRLSDQEFETIWLPVRWKIVKDSVPIPIEVLDISLNEGLFIDPTWQVIPLITSIEHGVTSPSYDQDTWRTWQETTTPGIYEFDSLFKTVRERGVSEICLSHDDSSVEERTNWRGGDHFVVYPSKESLDDFRENRALWIKAWIAGLVFDLSAEWGLVNLAHDNLSFLGGTADFMAHYFRNAGGYEHVKKRFYDYDIWGWGTLLRETEQVYADWIYKYLGWEKPVYPPDSCGYLE